MEMRIKVALVLVISALLVSCNTFKDKKIYNYLEHLDFKDTTTINLEEVLNMPIDSFYIFEEFSFAEKPEGLNVETIGEIIGIDYNGTDVLYHKARIIIMRDNMITYEETWDNHDEILFEGESDVPYYNLILHVKSPRPGLYSLSPI